MKKVNVPFSLIFSASLFLSAFQTSQSPGVSPLFWVALVICLAFIGYCLYGARGERAALATRMPVRPKMDDLTIIEGIGPKIATILQTAGINTFDQLAHTDVNRLRKVCEQGGIRLVDPKSWPEQAQLAAAGDMEGLKILQSRLTAGRAKN